MIDNVNETIKSFGKDSRVIVRVLWKNGSGGHVFIAETIRKKARFIDPQSNRKNVKKIS